jgi:Domain of unknown function (DUF4260)
MKNIIKLEEAAMFAASIYFLVQFNPAWWVYLILLLGPDISMLGYLGGNKTGALFYDLFHHKGVAIAIYFIGVFIKSDILLISGIVLFGHSSMDRMFGYGLKLNEGFKFTHLGRIGKI